MSTDLGWTALEWTGVEHVIVSSDATGFRADSQVIMAWKDLMRVGYRLECDARWRATRLTVQVTSAEGERALAVAADGAGHWLVDGQPLPALDGCIDVDIRCTPLTNTLPIRRLDWSRGTSHDLDVAFVSVPELTIRPVRQRYTLLGRDEAGHGARYRYESGSFRADLLVDGEGFVVDYPGEWRRLHAQNGMPA
jgi:uncharacterized protein